MRMRIFFLFPFCFLFCSAAAQEPRVVLRNMEQQYQSCLDKGEGMAGCATRFYEEMDSMLNIAYRQLRHSMKATEKTKLQIEQRTWLVRRDAYFKKLDAVVQKKKDKKEYGTEDLLITIDDKARFVKERVEVLLSGLENSPYYR